jgi:hypothetical protein
MRLLPADNIIPPAGFSAAAAAFAGKTPEPPKEVRHPGSRAYRQNLEGIILTVAKTLQLVIGKVCH